MILLIATLALPAAPLDGDAILPGRKCYTMSRALPEGQKPFGKMSQSIVRRKHKGIDALEISTHQQIANPRGTVNLKDFYLVRRSDLRPLTYRSVMDGKTTVDIVYEEGRVVGTRINIKDEKIQIDQLLTGPVWDGGLWGPTLAALPLKMNGSYEVPTYHYSKGVGAFHLKVVGEQMIDTPAGPERAWVIDGYSDPKRVARYYISKKKRQELGWLAGGMTQSLSESCPTES